MSNFLNGSLFRALINGETVNYERRTSFEPDNITVIVYETHDVSQYDKWLARKGESVNFKITDTDIDLQVTLTHVIKHFAHDSVVEIELKFQ